MYIKRKIEDTILKYLKVPEILAITGPRQAGKTTLLQRIQGNLSNSIFLSFEDRETVELFEQDIKGFAQKYSQYHYIFIDEFQHAKNGGKNLKYMYDVQPGNKLIISGSSAIDLTIRALKFLVGRVFIFNLFQFDFFEFLSFREPDLFKIYQQYKDSFNLKEGKFGKVAVSEVVNNQLNKYLDEFIIWGGYPRVVLATDKTEKETILKNIYSTYFLRDIKDILGLVDDFKLSRLIKALAVQLGQLVEYNELSRLSEYDYLTLKKYLNILEKTFIVCQVRPFYKNKRSEISKNPKIYFFDAGLRNYVINNFNSLNSRVDKGFLYENFVFCELIKDDIAINFWRTKAKAEVDFIAQVGPQLLPVESKSEISSLQISRAFNSFISQYRPENALLLNSSQIGIKEKDKTKIFFLPRWII